MGLWTRGLGDAGTWDAGTRGRRDAGTRGRGDAGTLGRGDVGTWGRGTRKRWDSGCGTRGRDKQTTPDFCAEFLSTIFSALEKDSLPFFQLVSGRNSTSLAIWLVPGAGGIFSSGTP